MFLTKELISTFPEAKAIIPMKINDWNNVKLKAIGIIKERMAKIKDIKADDFSKWFYTECVKQTECPVIREANKQISRLKRMLISICGVKIEGHIGESEIETARAISIKDIIEQTVKLKQCGKNYMGLCPFHKEKNPSFYVYPETNSWYCFSCNNGGDSISFVEKLYGIDFLEAVKFLNK